MKYCKECILPTTRPGVVLDDNGVCLPCRNSKLKTQKIDWVDRERVFSQLVKDWKSNTKGYDCLIPVSGGKDSTWQVIKCLEYGLKPLCVTWKTPGRTELGKQNLDSLVNLGVDHIDYQISPEVEKRFMLASLEKYGSTAVPMHMAMFAIPLKIALKFEIPAVIWGENSAFEYGGKDQKLHHELNEEWLKAHGNTFGTSASDWIGVKGLTEKDLTPYFNPGPDQLKKSNIAVVFLGSFFPWDPEVSLNVARKSGFKSRTEGPKTGYWNYADIDDDYISIHHYLKWYKFGCTRLFDNLSVEIRLGRMNRNEALDILMKYGDQKPQEDISKLCNFMEIKENQFFNIIEKFRNLDIWKKDPLKGWYIPNFILKDWNWNS